MEKKARQSLYLDFIECIRSDIQGERKIANRRMFNVFLWCFLLPGLITGTIILLVKFQLLPRTAARYLDLIVLVFPILYSLYVLSSEVLMEVPAAFRQGGISTSLGQAIKECEWRVKMCESLEKAVAANADDWRWILASFKIDLERIRSRTKYLTALAGAVLFLLMQGIDSIGGSETVTDWSSKNTILGWFEASSSNLAQFVALGLVLVLLYLSGNQTYYALFRYQNCAELLIFKEERRARIHS